MIAPRHTRRLALPRLVLALLAAACAAPPSHAQDAQPRAPSAPSQNATLDEYRAHLVKLQAVTADCAKARNADACDPALIGADDRLTLGDQKESRIVRYHWLRVLFLRAIQKDDVAKSSAATPAHLGPGEASDVRTTTQLLEDAQPRLATDIAQVDSVATHLPAHNQERAILQQVLAGKEFRNLKQPDGKESALERLGNWLNKLFEGLNKLPTHAAWVGRLLFWGFISLVGIAAAYLLLQMERRWRVRLVPESDGPAPTAASARDWQLWLKDARESAAHREWREAIHFMYWAAISRLESKKLWPADRARTPREYLALVAPDDPRKTSLGALTREFEWTWYGGRSAGEEQYQRAEELASALFESGAARSGGSAR